MRVTASLILITLIAGCLQAADVPDAIDTFSPTFDPEWHLRALAAEPGHDHNNASQHRNRSTPNFQQISYDSVVADHYGVSTQDYGCGATSVKDGRRITVVPSFASDVAFMLFDMTDLSQPKKIGELVLTNANVYDITVTPDQQFVVIATNVLDSGPDAPPTPAPGTFARPQIIFRDACSGETSPVAQPEGLIPFPAGIVLVDIANPAMPRVVDYRPMPIEGGHSIQAATIKGRGLILLTVFEFVHEASYFVLYEVQQTPAGPKLALLSIIPGLEPDGTIWGASGVPGVHDGFLAVHPGTGESLAYLATGPTGVKIYNIDDPTEPKFRGQWKDFAPFGDTAPETWFFHSTVAASELWDGRHYTFTSEECPAHREKMASCVVVALDTTDPAQPTFVGAWAMPGDAAWGEIYDYSTHHIALHKRTLFVTLVHGGLWAIDVSSLEAIRSLPSIGAFVPTEEPLQPSGYYRRSVAMGPFWDGTVFQRTPCVLDVDVVSEEGDLIVTDTASGIYVVRFDESNPAPAPAPWPLGYNES